MQTKLYFASEILGLDRQLVYQLQDEKWWTIILFSKESADQRTIICSGADDTKMFKVLSFQPREFYNVGNVI